MKWNELNSITEHVCLIVSVGQYVIPATTAEWYTKLTL